MSNDIYGVPFVLEEYLEKEEVYFTKIKLSHVNDIELKNLYTCKGCGIAWNRDFDFKSNFRSTH